MTAESSTLEDVALGLGRALSPLVTAMGSDSDIRAHIAEIGWDLPTPPPPAFAGLQGSLVTVANALDQLDEQRASVHEGEADEDTLLPKLGALLIGVLAFTTELVRLPDQLRAQLPSAYLAQTGIADEIQVRLLEDAVVRAVADLAPLAHALLILLGFLEEEERDADPSHSQPDFIERKVRLDRLGTFFSDPLELYREVYGWGTPQIDADRLFRALQRVATRLMVPAEIRYPTQALVSTVNPGAIIPVADGPDPMLIVPLVSVGGLSLELGVLPVPKLTPTELQGMAFTLAGNVTFSEKLPIATNLAIKIDAELDVSTGLALVLWPDKPPSFSIGLGGAPVFDVNGQAMVRLVYGREGEPTRLLSIPGGSRFEIGSAEIGFGITKAGSQFDPAVEAALKQGRLVITTAEADGFLARILPEDGIEVEFDFGVAWSQSAGLRFSGGAALETTFALGLTLGPLHIDSLTLLLAIAAEGIRLDLAITGGGTLGPVSASIDKIGLSSRLAFSEGNLGPVDLGFAFKPPTGLGIAVDAGPVSGGGFISFDPDNGRYAGVLQLSIYAVTVTAIGLLDTRLPSGASGFSFLIVISVEFTPIQLGFGFTLNGVGGLAGINRTFVVEALQAGVRAGNIDHILFPRDVVRNAPQIISDLRTVFPPAEGRYVFGPMLIIGWGTPTLVEAKLGIILEVPSPVVIAILGQVNVVLPTKDAAVVELHLDVLGVIDFGKKLFSLDASLHHSRIAIFSIEGDMALRLSWGDSPSFALSIGGFNPHFTPPPGFPDLKRLTIGLNVGDIVRITIQGYLAITSNSFQIGVRAEALIDAGIFNVYGWLGFDALFIFSPFSFIVDFTAGLALRSGTTTLLGISLEGSFAGPTPWHIEGTAKFTILFFEIGVHVSQTWGEEQGNALPSVNPWPELESALKDPRNWSPALEADPRSLVTLAQSEASEPGTGAVLLDPSGGASVRQRVLPFGMELQKLGEAVPEGQTRFDIDSVSLAGSPVSFDPVMDDMARGQFQRLSDQEKLSLPSFEKMQVGIVARGDVATIGRNLQSAVEFETVYVDSVTERRTGPRYLFEVIHQVATAALSPAASMLATRGLTKLIQPGSVSKVNMGEEQWVVARTSDMSRVAHVTLPTTKGAASAALNAHLSASPGDRGKLQVVALHELEEAS